MKDHTNPWSPKTADRLTIEQRMQMLACLLSDKTLFATARIRLKLDYFTSIDEAALRVLWAVSLALSSQHGVDFLFGVRAQVWNVLDTECRAYAASHPDECPPQFQDFLFRPEVGFLPWLYGKCQPEEFHYQYGHKLLGDFLRERAVSDLFQQLTRDAGGKVVTNVSQLAHKLAEREAEVSMFGADPVESGAPEGWLPPPVKRRPTGIRWLDGFLRGGHAGPENYGVCGAYGSGKTTLGIQLTFNSAKMELFLASDRKARILIDLDPDEPFEAGHCYYFFYEMPAHEIRLKLWSCAARVDSERLRLLGKKGFQLSTANNLSDEEKKILTLAGNQFGMPLAQGEKAAQAATAALADFPGEQERLDAALKVIRKNVWMVDMTGSGSNQGQGTGYVPEIAAILSNERRKGRKIACVVIDYAQACVDRHTADQYQKYDCLSQFGRRVEHELGVPFETPVWVLGQLSGAANQRTAATKQHHSDAAGSKRFAENLWFAFNLGTVDDRAGVRYWTCSKARRSDLGTPPLLKIAGGGPGKSNFNQLIDVSHQFYMDNGGKVKEKGKAPGGAKVVDTGGKVLNAGDPVAVADFDQKLASAGDVGEFGEKPVPNEEQPPKPPYA